MYGPEAVVDKEVRREGGKARTGFAGGGNERAAQTPLKVGEALPVNIMVVVVFGTGRGGGRGELPGLVFGIDHLEQDFFPVEAFTARGALVGQAEARQSVGNIG